MWCKVIKTNRLHRTNRKKGYKMIYEFFKENFGDMFEGMTPKEIIKTIIGSIAAIVILWGAMAVGSAYEDHVRCLNGATEYCIESDFQNK